MSSKFLRDFVARVCSITTEKPTNILSCAKSRQSCESVVKKRSLSEHHLTEEVAKCTFQNICKRLVRIQVLLQHSDQADSQKSQLIM